jgi:hypothetical protein
MIPLLIPERKKAAEECSAKLSATMLQPELVLSEVEASSAAFYEDKPAPGTA